MSISDVLIRDADPAPTSTPDPLDPQTVANLTVSNYYLAVLLILAAIAVIALSLAFAFRYHSKLIEVVKRAVGPSTPIAISNDNVLAQSAGPALTGPTEGVVGSKLAFSVERPLDGVTISWVAEKGDPSSDTGTSFATSYAKAGSYEVRRHTSMATTRRR